MDCSLMKRELKLGNQDVKEIAYKGGASNRNKNDTDQEHDPVYFGNELFYANHPYNVMHYNIRCQGEDGDLVCSRGLLVK